MKPSEWVEQEYRRTCVEHGNETYRPVGRTPGILRVLDALVASLPPVPKQRYEALLAGASDDEAIRESANLLEALTHTRLLLKQTEAKRDELSTCLRAAEKQLNDLRAVLAR